MSEKEIKKTNVVGKNVEDLTKEELAEVQGQGSEDTNAEAFKPTIYASVQLTVQKVTLGSNICRKL